jgi:hypothetical protein
MCMECVVLDIMGYCWYYLGHIGGHVGIAGHIGDHVGIHVPCWARWGQRRAHASAAVTATTAVVATAAKAVATAAAAARAVAAPEADLLLSSPVRWSSNFDIDLRVFACARVCACVWVGLGPVGPIGPKTLKERPRGNQCTHRRWRGRLAAARRGGMSMGNLGENIWKTAAL